MTERSNQRPGGAAIEALGSNTGSSAGRRVSWLARTRLSIAGVLRRVGRLGPVIPLIRAIMKVSGLRCAPRQRGSGKMVPQEARIQGGKLWLHPRSAARVTVAKRRSEKGRTGATPLSHRSRVVPAPARSAARATAAGVTAVARARPGQAPTDFASAAKELRLQEPCLHLYR